MMHAIVRCIAVLAVASGLFLWADGACLQSTSAMSWSVWTMVLLGGGLTTASSGQFAKLLLVAFAGAWASAHLGPQYIGFSAFAVVLFGMPKTIAKEQMLRVASGALLLRMLLLTHVSQSLFESAGDVLQWLGLWPDKVGAVAFGLHWLVLPMWLGGFRSGFRRHWVWIVVSALGVAAASVCAAFLEQFAWCFCAALISTLLYCIYSTGPGEPVESAGNLRSWRRMAVLSVPVICLIGLCAWVAQGYMRVAQQSHVVLIQGEHWSPGWPPAIGQRDDAGPSFRSWMQALGSLPGSEVVVRSLEEVVATESGVPPAASAYVLINPDARFPPEVSAWLRDRVVGGARLLLACDHTDLFGQMAVVNGLLKGTGIELEFNSIVPRGAENDWGGAMCVGTNWLFGHSYCGEAVGWSVGAGLHVSAPASVLACGGRRSFVDKGIVGAPAGLDNLNRDIDEAITCQALAAVAPLGRGEVLVLGDTSCLQSGQVEVYTGTIDRLNAWLHGGVRHWVWWWMTCMSVIVALFVLILRLPVWVIALVGALPIVACDLFGARLAQLADPLVSVDTRFEPCRNDPNGVPDRVGDVCALLSERVGLTRLGADECPVRVYMRPRGAISASAAMSMLERVKGGERMLVFVDKTTGLAWRHFIDLLGVTIGQPVGRGTGTARFASAKSSVSVDMDYAFALNCDIASKQEFRADIIARRYELATAVCFSVGEGVIVLVSDAGCYMRRALHDDEVRGAGVARALDAYLSWLMPVRK